MNFTIQGRYCHASPREASLCPSRETLREARGDNRGSRFAYSIQQKEDNSMQHILNRAASVVPLDTAAMELARTRQQQLTKPAGSLGRLEDIAVQIAGITGHPLPRIARKAVIIMAGDHGVTSESVSAYPPAVTLQMV